MTAPDPKLEAKQLVVECEAAMRMAEVDLDQAAQSYGRGIGLIALATAIVVATGQASLFSTDTSSVLCVTGAVAFVCLVAALRRTDRVHKAARVAGDALRSAQLDLVRLERADERTAIAALDTSAALRDRYARAPIALLVIVLGLVVARRRV